MKPVESRTIPIWYNLVWFITLPTFFALGYITFQYINALPVNDHYHTTGFNYQVDHSQFHSYDYHHNLTDQTYHLAQLSKMMLIHSHMMRNIETHGRDFVIGDYGKAIQLYEHRAANRLWSDHDKLLFKYHHPDISFPVKPQNNPVVPDTLSTKPWSYLSCPYVLRSDAVEAI
jgi:hypothetical protein